MKPRLLPLLVACTFGAAGCSILVTADRTKIKDDLFTPTPDAGGNAPEDEADSGAEDAGTDAAPSDSP